MMDFRAIARALRDPENQPHQWNDQELAEFFVTAADEIKRLRGELLQIKQQSMETHIRAMAHQALYQNEAQILATNTYEAEGRN